MSSTRPTTPPNSEQSGAVAGVTWRWASGRSSRVFEAWINSGPRSEAGQVRISIFLRPATINPAHGWRIESEGSVTAAVRVGGGPAKL